MNIKQPEITFRNSRTYSLVVRIEGEYNLGGRVVLIKNFHHDNAEQAKDALKRAQIWTESILNNTGEGQ